MEERELWERMPGEKTDYYNKFVKYRDMDTGRAKNKRSLRLLADELGCSRQSIERLSVKFNWVERVEAYDLYLEQELRHKREKEIIRMHDNHAKIASQIITKATKRLLTLPEEEISAADVVRMFDIGVKIERLSRGEPTENKHLSGSTTITHDGSVDVNQRIDVSELTDEELTGLERILEKLH